MKLTKQEWDGYLTGKLRLYTSRVTKVTTLIPARKDPRDRGITNSYARMKRRLDYLEQLGHSTKAPVGRRMRLRAEAKKPELTLAEKKAAYMKQWRAKNKEHLRAFEKRRGWRRPGNVGYVPQFPHAAPAPAAPSLLQRLVRWGLGV